MTEDFLQMRVRMINNYDHHDETLKKLKGELQVDVGADGRVLLTGTVRLTTQDPTTYQEIALEKTEVPVLEMMDYLKKQEKARQLFNDTAEKVYQEVLEKTEAAAKTDAPPQEPGAAPGKADKK